MKKIVPKIAAVLFAFALLLPGVILIGDLSTASASSTVPTYGAVTVSGPNILVNGQPGEKFNGVVDTTALAYAVMAYIDGETQYAGKTSVFDGPDTSNLGTISQNSNATVFWDQYFALMQYYGYNLVRIGCADAWGSQIQYQAWTQDHAQFVSLLDTMLAAAQAHQCYVVLVLAGSQAYPAYQFGGSGSVFVPGSSAYENYITYARGLMSDLSGQVALAWYDMFNEPDCDNDYTNFWSTNGGSTAFHTWACDVAADTAGASDHPRTMGTAALGLMFSWNKADFDLATGTVPFEIAEVHYYGSNSDPSNFAMPQQWAAEDNKPLFWGELGYNAVYPITRYMFAENSIWSNGGQAITSMVLTGTANYPYTGGALPTTPITTPSAHTSGASSTSTSVVSTSTGNSSSTNASNGVSSGNESTPAVGYIGGSSSVIILAVTLLMCVTVLSLLGSDILRRRR